MKTYTWAELSAGMKHSFTACFTEQMAADFARLSGDMNPLHVDKAYAAAKGFPEPVLFGMMSSSLYSQLIGMYLPGKLALLQGIDIDFHSPCYVGEVLHVEGEIVFLSDATRRIEVKASIRKENGKLVSKATIRAGMHGE